MKIKLNLDKQLIDRITNINDVGKYKTTINEYLEKAILDQLNNIEKIKSNMDGIKEENSINNQSLINKEKEKYLDSINSYKRAKKIGDRIVLISLALIITFTLYDTFFQTKNYILSLIISILTIAGLMFYIIYTNSKWKEVININKE